jgi:hypothetical protein
LISGGDGGGNGDTAGDHQSGHLPLD